MTKTKTESLPQSYCFKCKKQTGTMNIEIEKTKNDRLLKIGKCVICGTKKSLGFVPKNKQSGTGIVDKFIENLLVELHLLGTDEKTGKIKKTSFTGTVVVY